MQLLTKLFKSKSLSLGSTILEGHLKCRLDDPTIHLCVMEKFRGYPWDTLYRPDVLFYLNMTPDQKAVDAVITEINRLGYKIVYDVVSNNSTVFIRINRSHSSDSRQSITKHTLKKRRWRFWE
jgi:hypothetical protein